jgi:putative serine protease PepD
MSTPLLRPTDPLNGRSFHQPPEPPTPPRRGGGRLAVLLIAAGLAGGAGATGILAATGALDDNATRTTTVIQQAATSGSSSGLDPAALYKAAAPGVVDITSQSSTAQTVPGPFGGQGEQTATGTGFVVDSDGHIATAAHVVDGASSVTVTFQDGTTRTAKVLGSDNATDLAVLSVDPAGLNLHPLQLGSSSALRIGDPIAAIGDPFHYARSLSTGVVSGVDRTIQAPNGFTVAHAVQTDAALNPGNSGGPVFDAGGKVIGVVDQIATGNSGAGQSSGVGFLVPSDILKATLADLIAGKDIHHAYIGISTDDAPGTTTGAQVRAVVPGGPAADAGIRAGDIATAIDGKPLKGSSDLVAAITDRRPGDAIKITLIRSGQTLTKTVNLGEQPAQRG